MPRLPTYKDVDQSGLRNTRRVIDGPRGVEAVSFVDAARSPGRYAPITDPRPEAIVNAGSAIVEITNRMEKVRVENAVRLADMKAAVALDKFKRDLSELDDDREYETRWNEGSKKILEDVSKGLDTNLAQSIWKERADQYSLRGLVEVRDLARKKVVEKERGNVLQMGAFAKNLEDDPNATDSLRAEARSSAIQAMKRMAETGIVGHDDAARFEIEMNNYALQKTQERSERALAQQYEDTIFTQSAGDYEAAQAAAREIKDPMMRDTVSNRLDERFSQMKRAENETEGKAIGAIKLHIANGGSFSTAPKESVAALSDDARAGFIEVEKNRAAAYSSGAVSAANKQSKLNLEYQKSIAENDPAAFIEPGYLEAIKNQFMPDDYTALLELRNKKQSGASGDAASKVYTDALKVATPILRQYGIDPLYKGKDSKLAKNSAQFQALLMSAASKFVQSNARDPSVSELDGLVKYALLNVDGEMIAGTPIIKGQNKPAVAVKDGAIGIKPMTPRVIPFADIPKDQVERIRVHLQKLYPGRRVTQSDVQNTYSSLLAGY